MCNRTTSIDLRPYGVEKTVELEGEIVEEFLVASGALVFLFDEDHAYVPGIQQNLRNACRLLDADVVDLIGVEASTGSVGDEVEHHLQRNGLPSLDRFVDQMEVDCCLRRFAAAEFTIFQHKLLMMRPAAPVYGIEDPEAYQEMLQELEELTTSLSNGSLDFLHQDLGEALSRRSNLTTSQERMRFRAEETKKAEAYCRQRMSAHRPVHFVHNLVRLRQELSCTGASIINAGSLEQDQVSEVIKQKGGLSIVRLQPHGLPRFSGGAEAL